MLHCLIRVIGHFQAKKVNSFCNFGIKWIEQGNFFEVYCFLVHFFNKNAIKYSAPLAPDHNGPKVWNPHLAW